MKPSENLKEIDSIISEGEKKELYSKERTRGEEDPISIFSVDPCYGSIKNVEEISGKEYLVEGIKLILEGLNKELGMKIDNENFRETPKRVAKAFLEMLSGEKDTTEQINEILKKSFPSEYKGMIIGSNIKVYSMCPHHLLPVSYTVNVGYIPSNKVIGASKLARLVNILAKRAVLQEDFTKDIADWLMGGINAAGIIVQVYGQHMCMECRGIKQSQSSIVTSEIRGNFEQKEVREEFALLVRDK